MPPFSGKKKKLQLQAKRQRKREEEEQSNALDRERERLREELVNRGEEVNDELLEAYARERYPRHYEPAHGRRAHRREREQQQHATKKDGSDGSNNAENSEADIHADTLMYSADRRHGVRSVFAKESAAVLAARKQLSYQPIPFRTTMPPTGIPFSEWFTFPSQVATTTTAAAPSQKPEKTRSDVEAEAAKDKEVEKAALIAAEQERRMDRPLVASTAEALGGGSGSAVFPFAVELPSRGWHYAEQPQPQPQQHGDDTKLNVEGSVEVESNALTAPGGAPSRTVAAEDGAKGCAATPSPVVVAAAEETVSGNSDGSDSSDRSGGGGDEKESEDSSASYRSSEEAEEDDKAGEKNVSNSSANADAQRAEALFIKKIEEARFEAYVRCLDAYPLPPAIAGLCISSYERNLEVWQQLWRTVELSDVLVIVADARYPILHAHLGLLTYITKVQRKPCVFVLNKEDLVPTSTLRCWQQFLYLYLTDLGFAVAAPDGVDKGVEAGTEADRCGGLIALRTFTANPRPETAGQRDEDVDVTRRQKHRRGADAKMYEKLRTGKLNATRRLGNSDRGSSCDDDNSDDSSTEDDELRYGATENFVGMQAAEHALQHDRRAYKELGVVAKKITDLLAVCRRLGVAGRVARGVAPPPATTTTTTAAAAAAAAEDAVSSYATSSLPCPAPRAARKNKKAQKRGGGGSGARRGKNRNVDSGGAPHSDDEDDVRDTAEDRAPDSPCYIHIGFIGHPNVGKSSLLNCIRGTKVVSVSATPGHTKHIQTIPVPEECLTLVDSPGLALPVFGVPRPLQAVLGTHQIAQTRDPQSGVSFLAAYLPIEKLYGLLRPDYAIKEDEWSPYELCEAYAKKRGYYVKHGKGTLDIHRAAIAILQEAYEGRLTLFYAPPELNFLQSAWYRERIRPHLLLTVFGPALP